jgi:hypothetical protein
LEYDARHARVEMVFRVAMIGATIPYVHAQRLIDVGGRRMNIYCSGAGSPAVILDAGLGSKDTGMLLRSSGHMGFSDPTTSPRDV